MSAHAEPRRGLPREIWIITALLAAALVAWIFVIRRMEGMNAGPGTDLGGFGWYVGVWVTMMAAMMLPSAAPMVMIFNRVSRERARKGGRQAVAVGWFVAGYLLAWTLYGLAAYGLYRAAVSLHWDFLSWDRAGRYLAAGIVATAGIYQLTPLKDICLRHCRSPLHFVLHGWREGQLGALRMGAEHGAYCVGCCWGLMLVLWGVGVMSITWMIAIASLILLEKVMPRGDRLTKPMAVAFIALGAWIAIAPRSVPALTVPGSAEARRAMERMSPSMKMDSGSKMNSGGKMNSRHMKKDTTPSRPSMGRQMKDSGSGGMRGQP